jgi:alpha-beta hydrolase superfamily lysophospholipase
MRSETFTLAASDNHPLFVYRWLPDAGVKAKAIVHIAHGMSEHAGRYARVAESLTAAGYVVYGNDHRGHGKTARTREELGFFGPGGWKRVVADLSELIAHHKGEQSGLPAVIFGHSMGSYMTQQFMYDHGQEVVAAILSGTSGKPPLLAAAGKVVASLERVRLGPRGRSKALTRLTFGGFNKAFAPNRTEFDWLSRDPAEVDAYIRDPLCGFPVTTSLWVELLDALAEIANPSNQARIRKDLPIYVFSGSRDPVGDNTKSVTQLLRAYADAGLRDLKHKFYPEARHETLNETNRDEVTRDLVAWLDTRLR